MSIFRSIQLCAALALTGLTPAYSQVGKLPKGLAIGETFEDLEAAGETNGWTLSADEGLLETWSVEGTEITLYFCGDVLWTIDQILPGGLREFVEMVRQLEAKHGKPETDVGIIPYPSQLHLIQSDFDTNDGLEVTVQIYQKGDRTTFWSRTANTSDCNED